MVAKKEAARMEKIEKARKVNERAAANRARIERDKKNSIANSDSTSTRIDPTLKKNAVNECPKKKKKTNAEFECTRVNVL